MPGEHRNLEYSFWANEQALGSAVLLMAGGFVGVLPFANFNRAVLFFEYYWASIYSLVVGLLVFLIEYPRGKRKKGTIVERRFQSPLAKLVTGLGPVTRNYYVRFIMYFAMAVPSCCLITCLLGGMGLALASLIYLVSAIKGEQWMSPESSSSPQAQSSAGKYLTNAPLNPPPRRPEGAARTSDD